MREHATRSDAPAGFAARCHTRVVNRPRDQHRTRVTIVALFVHLIVTSLTWRDLARRSAGQIRGSAQLWRVASGLNTLGSVAYWTIGRKS